MAKTWEMVLRNLEPNWDSHGGVPISDVAIEIARAWHHITVVPCSNGGVQLEWHRDGWDVEIDIAPSGEVDVNAGRSEGTTEGVGEGSGQGGCPPSPDERVAQPPNSNPERIPVSVYRTDEVFGYDRWMADQYSCGKGEPRGVLLIYKDRAARDGGKGGSPMSSNPVVGGNDCVFCGNRDDKAFQASQKAGMASLKRMPICPTCGAPVTVTEWLHVYPCPFDSDVVGQETDAARNVMCECTPIPSDWICQPKESK